MITAIVKGNSLDCYGWEHEDGLIITSKLELLCPENNTYLVNAINQDKNNAEAAVSTDQIIFIDGIEELKNMNMIFENEVTLLFGSGGAYIGFTIDKPEAER